MCVFLHGVTVSKPHQCFDHDTHISMMVSLLFKCLHVITVCLLSEQRLCQDERSSATRFPEFSGRAGWRGGALQRRRDGWRVTVRRWSGSQRRPAPRTRSQTRACRRWAWARIRCKRVCQRLFCVLIVILVSEPGWSIRANDREYCNQPQFKKKVFLCIKKSKYSVSEPILVFTETWSACLCTTGVE